MKRMLNVFLYAFLAFGITVPAFAAEMKIVNLIPERYATLLITGVEPDKTLDKDAILKIAKEQFKNADVEQFQYVIYDMGKKPGDGMRAYGEMRKNKNVRISEFSEVKGKDAQEKEKLGKFFENFIGYQAKPAELHSAYSDNEVVADEDFKGKPILLQIKVPSVAKDALGDPYIKVDIERYGLSGVQIFLDKKDPFLRRIKKGSTIVIKGYPRGFIMQSVIIDGKVIQDEKAILIDGKAFEKKGK